LATGKSRHGYEFSGRRFELLKNTDEYTKADGHAK